MNVFHKLTVQSLKKNKTRTLVTIIGIILSAAMITAVTAFASSFLQFSLESSVYQDGSWHGNILGITAQSAENIREKEEIAASQMLQQLGYSPLADCKNEAKPYLYLLGTEKNPSDILPIHITSGRYPQNSGEILLPNHLMTNGGIVYSIGDTMELPLGSRMLEGESLTQINPYFISDENGKEVPRGETFTLRETRTYKVVGFFDRISYSIEDYSAPGYTALTVMDDTPSDDYLYDLYFQMQNPRDLFAFMEENEIYGSQNHELLMYLGVFKFGNFRSTLLHLSEIVIALIVFGSVSLIYNAFSISMSERTKQFGLLSSVGATKRQLAGMIRWEAWLLSLVGIPIGILSGILGIGVTLHFIGDKFSAMGMPVALHLHVEPWGVVAAAAIALITVFLSAWLPARKLKKQSALEAIRQNQDIAVKEKQLHTGKLTLKVFGLPGTLAQKYFRRSRKKYRATVISLFMSILLFISAFTFTQYMENSVSMGLGDNDCDLTLFLPKEDRPGELSIQDIFTLIRSEETVTEAAFVTEHHGQGQIPVDALTKDMLEALQPEGEIADVPLILAFAEDAAYDRYLRQQNLKPEDFRSAKQGILLDSAPFFNADTHKYDYLSLLKNSTASMDFQYTKIMEGFYPAYLYQDESGEEIAEYTKKEGHESIKMPAQQAVQQIPLHIGARLNKRPYFIGESHAFVILYPESIRKQMLPDWESQEQAVDYSIRSSDHEKTGKNLEILLAQNRVSTKHLTDLVTIREGNRNIITIVRVLSTGFIVLISLIAAANVFNTITTNIGLRRRDFAMLRSVGMTRKQLTGMMNYECILYGSKSLLYGLPAAIFISMLIWKSVSGSFNIGYTLPWLAIGIAVCSVFLVVFSTMLYAMSKIKKANILESLRSENL